MTDRDDETFGRFAVRFARIEPFVADRPRDVARRRPIGPAFAAALGVMVAVMVVGGIMLGGRLGFPAPVASRPAGDGSIAGSPDASGVAVKPPPASAPGPASGPVEPVAIVPLDPAEPPEELPPPCLTRMTTYDRMVTTPAEDAANSQTVVVGRVTGVGAAQWNTPGGRAPVTRPERSEAADVIRLIRIEVEETIRGVPVAPVITIWIPGGTIGCQRYLMGGFMDDIAIGDRYLVFVGDDSPRNGLVGVLQAWQLWPIDGPRVTTEFVPNLSLADVLEQMRASPPVSSAP
ncbi:MAG: hypothetical protein H0V73_05625 [Chloroflexi bacterium]|nr:hypothetical protein [Chloroflexota bacterium]